MVPPSTDPIQRIRQTWRTLEAGRKFAVGPLQPGDGHGVAQLFYTIYGDRYPVKEYYLPERIEEMQRKGSLLTVVARLDNGDIAGLGSFYQSSPPNKALYEFGQLMVAPEYRHSTMAGRITQEMERLSRTMTQAQGFFGEAVCNHLMTQKLVGKQGYSECGLEVALMPTGAYEKEGAGALRVSCLLAARVDRDQCQPLHLPQSYRQELELILNGFSLQREIVFHHTDAPVAAQTQVDRQVFDFAQVERVQVAAIGADFPEWVATLDQEARQRHLAAVQVFLNTGGPGVALAVAALRQRGFFLGGLIPLWFGPDALLLQKLSVDPEFDSILLYSDKAKAILDCVRADYHRVTRAS